MLGIVPESLEKYALDHSGGPSALLQELEAYTHSHCDMPQMLMGPLEGALLQMLIRLTDARCVLEIGLFTGYSALTMAEALPEGGELITCDVNPKTSKIAQSFFDRSPHGKKIQIRLGPALETIQTFDQSISFDLVLIDADKENYANYFDVVWPHIPSGGLVVADNTLWSGRVLDPQETSDKAIDAFNKKIHARDDLDHLLLTVRDGVMLIRKK